MSLLFGIGVGASGAFAAARVDDGIACIAARLVGVGSVVGRSRAYENPAWGGITRAPFVNAAVVVAVPWTASTLLDELFVIERAFGRVRGQKNAARTLDLDVLWSSSSSSSSSASSLQVPHPRLCERAFAVRPLVEALRAAGVVVELALQRAADAHGLAPLTPVCSSAAACSQ